MANEYAYIVDNKISEIFPSNEKAGKCIKMPDDWWVSPTHDYKYDPDTDSIVEDNNPPGPPVPNQAELDKLQLEGLRGERNMRLAETDWVVTQALETGVAEASEWKNYRQALRDITKTYKSQMDVVWPTKPS